MQAHTPTRSRFREFCRNNGLSLTVTAIFVVLMGAQTLTGHAQFNEERRSHGEAALPLPEYLGSGHFVEATAENWESEFLQMAFYVWLTSFLFQKGSSESKKLDEPMPVDRDPRDAKNNAGAPWPVRRGGMALRIYQYSLSYAFALLFLVSFAMHAVGGARAESADRIAHGESPVSMVQYLGGSRFWFESFQNWQSEFLSLSAMVLLSIFLRHRGSPESKPVDAPHHQTGD
jgi:hypothetical protein